MTATIIRLPEDPRRLRAAMSAVRERARSNHASADALRRALQTLLRELANGRSTGAAVALATGELRPARAHHHGAAS